MKVMVLGSGGFMGSGISRSLAQDYEVVGASTRNLENESVYTNLLNIASIEAALVQVKPEVVINCAGIINNDESAQNNVLFTSNLLNAVAAVLRPRRIIIAGSASEYGVVDRLPVNEDFPLNAVSAYARSKVDEEEEARRLSEELNLPVVVARVFNPIGLNMNPKQLLPNIISQVNEIKSGLRDVLEVSRLDSSRDYVDVRDVAGAMKVLIENDPLDDVYNIGTGISTSTRELIGLVIAASGLDFMPEVHETVDVPEQQVASKADISRMRNEFGWTPVYKLEDSIKEIVRAQVK